MSERVHGALIADDTDRERTLLSKADMWLLTATSVYLAINCVFGFPWRGEFPDYAIYGRFAVSSFLTAIGVLVVRFCGLRFKWFVVVLVIALLAVSFFINAHYLAAITASV